MSEVNTNDFIEAIRAQRTEALDGQARWFAQYVAEKQRADKLDTRVKELEQKYEPKPEEPLKAVA